MSSCARSSAAEGTRDERRGRGDEGRVGVHAGGLVAVSYCVWPSVLCHVITAQSNKQDWQQRDLAVCGEQRDARVRILIAVL